MYSIDELVKQTGISKRTIHYYVKLGLLPNPGTRGPSTRYGDEYLDRMRIIEILKANHLPLGEIALLLNKLSRSEISRLSTVSEKDILKTFGEVDVKNEIRLSKEDMEQADASEYIENVLKLSSPTPSKSSRRRIQSQMFNAPPPATAWDRFTISKGIELHVDNSINAKDKALATKLLNHAKKLFRKS